MKTLLSILLIGYTLVVSGQNKENNNVVQQQRMDNNIGNINAPYISAIQEIQTRDNDSNTETSQVSLNPNLIISAPSFNFNRYTIKQENINPKKAQPKRVEDFRIKTGRSSSGVSHKPKRGNKTFKKKVLKPIKCFAKRTFKHTAKYQLSCECFKF